MALLHRVPRPALRRFPAALWPGLVEPSFQVGMRDVVVVNHSSRANFRALPPRWGFAWNLLKGPGASATWLLTATALPLRSRIEIVTTQKARRRCAATQQHRSLAAGGIRVHYPLCRRVVVVNHSSRQGGLFDSAQGRQAK